MSEIKVRNDKGSEFSFSSVEEFVDAIRCGGVTAAWEVFHTIAKRWLPVTQHPAFDKRPGEVTPSEG
jgi:hypothetical protein